MTHKEARDKDREIVTLVTDKAEYRVRRKDLCKYDSIFAKAVEGSLGPEDEEFLEVESPTRFICLFNDATVGHMVGFMRRGCAAGGRISARDRLDLVTDVGGVGLSEMLSSRVSAAEYTQAKMYYGVFSSLLRGCVSNSPPSSGVHTLFIDALAGVFTDEFYEENKDAITEVCIFRAEGGTNAEEFRQPFILLMYAVVKATIVAFVAKLIGRAAYGRDNWTE